MWIRLARSIFTAPARSPVTRKQCENCTGSSSADAPALRAVTCTAPRSNTTCDRSTGTNVCVPADATKASDSKIAGFAAIRRNNPGH